MRVDLSSILLLLCAGPWRNEGGGSFHADARDDGLRDRKCCGRPVDGNETPGVACRCDGCAAVGRGGDGGRSAVCCGVQLLRCGRCGAAGGLGEWAGALLYGPWRFERAGEQQPGECDGGTGGCGLERGDDGGAVDPAGRESGGERGCGAAGGRDGGGFACRSAARRDGDAGRCGIRRERVGDRCALRERSEFAAGLPEQRCDDGGGQFFDVGESFARADHRERVVRDKCDADCEFAVSAGAGIWAGAGAGLVAGE